MGVETSFITVTAHLETVLQLLLFSPPPKWCCLYELSHNNLCWDCRLYNVWTAGGNGLRFLCKKSFHPQQLHEAKSKRLLVSTCFVAGLGLCMMIRCRPTGPCCLTGTQSVKGGGLVLCLSSMLKVMNSSCGFSGCFHTFLVWFSSEKLARESESEICWNTGVFCLCSTTNLSAYSITETLTAVRPHVILQYKMSCFC